MQVHTEHFPKLQMLHPSIINLKPMMLPRALADIVPARPVGEPSQSGDFIGYSLTDWESTSRRYYFNLAIRELEHFDTQGRGGGGAGAAGRQASAGLIRNTWLAGFPEEGLELVPQAQAKRATEGESIGFRLSLPGVLLEGTLPA